MSDFCSLFRFREYMATTSLPRTPSRTVSFPLAALICLFFLLLTALAIYVMVQFPQAG
jgi:hypothetical protein